MRAGTPRLLPPLRALTPVRTLALTLILLSGQVACGPGEERADGAGEDGRVAAAGDGVDQDDQDDQDGERLARSTSRLVRVMRRNAAAADFSAGELVEALARVAEQPSADALPSLQTLSTHADEEVRFNVVLALQALGGDQAQALVAGMAAEDESELVRLAAGED